MSGARVVEDVGDSYVNPSPALGLPWLPGGVVDRLVVVPDRLPGPALAWYLVLALVLVVAAEGIHAAVTGWAGLAIEPAPLLPIFVLAFYLAMGHVLRAIARSAYAVFRPALGSAAPAGDAVAQSLVRNDDRRTLATIVLTEVIIFPFFATDPATLAAMPTSAIDSGVVWGLWFAAVVALAMVISQAIGQVRAVARLHRMATEIDLFRPAAIRAFSSFTLALGLALLLSGVPGLMSPQAAIQLPIIGVLAAACFFLPLRGMHDRMSEAKASLLDATNHRMQLVRSRVHAAVDADDLGRIEQLGAAMSTILAEREALQRLPTWPWSTAIFRGFVSAVLLPILVWLVIRVLERIL